MNAFVCVCETPVKLVYMSIDCHFALPCGATSVQNVVHCAPKQPLRLSRSYSKLEMM